MGFTVKFSRYTLTLTVMLLLVSGCTRTKDTGSGEQKESAAETGLAPAPVSDAEIPPYSRSNVDMELPDFSLKTLEGGTITQDDLKGKITLVNFWATWCAPCVIEIPDLVVLYDDWKDLNFEIVGVSLDDDGIDLVRPFTEEMAMNYPVALDDGSLADALGGVYALPTTFIIDENGRVQDRFIGIFPVDEMRDELAGMIRRSEQ